MLAVNAWSSHDESLQGGSYHCSLIATPPPAVTFAVGHRLPKARLQMSIANET